MSVEYDSRLAVGFRITDEELEIFRHDVPERSHLEPRYDPKTGFYLGKLPVVDRPAGSAFLVPGSDTECRHKCDLVEEICDLIGASYWADGSYYEGELDYVIGPGFPGKELSPEESMALRPELDRIARELLRLGLKPGDAVITSTLLVY